jgi:hypothetical protein
MGRAAGNVLPHAGDDLPGFAQAERLRPILSSGWTKKFTHTKFGPGLAFQQPPNLSGKKPRHV